MSTLSSISSEFVLPNYSLAPNDVLNSIGGFKFGGMEQYCHTYNVHVLEILADFNLAVET